LPSPGSLMRVLPLSGSGLTQLIRSSDGDSGRSGKVQVGGCREAVFSSMTWLILLFVLFLLFLILPSCSTVRITHPIISLQSLIKVVVDVRKPIRSMETRSMESVSNVKILLPGFFAESAPEAWEVVRADAG
jgi:hypothetical protein